MRNKFNWWILILSVLYGLLIIPLFYIMSIYNTQLESLSRSTPYFLAVAFVAIPFYLIIRFGKKQKK